MDIRTSPNYISRRELGLKLVSAESRTLTEVRPDWPNRFYTEHGHKHGPAPDHLWQRSVIVAQTGQRGGVAQFGPGLDCADLCMRCVTEGTFLPDARASVAAYALEVEFEVGASRGLRTRIVYAEWHQGGSVHGRPITEPEILAKPGGDHWRQLN